MRRGSKPGRIACVGIVCKQPPGVTREKNSCLLRGDLVNWRIQGTLARMSDSDSASSDSSGATAVAPARPRPDKKKKPKNLPPFHVILLNDDDHSYEYVIEMLQVLFGHPPEKGYQMAKEVDSEGRVIVLTTHKEMAELKRDQIHAYGEDPRVATCQGSMSATIEPAEE